MAVARSVITAMPTAAVTPSTASPFMKRRVTGWGVCRKYSRKTSESCMGMAKMPPRPLRASDSATMNRPRPTTKGSCLLMLQYVPPDMRW